MNLLKPLLRNNFYLLVVIAAVSVILRVCASLYLGDGLTGVQQTRVEDQVSYDLLARAILAGRGYTFQMEWYPFTPAHTPTAHWSFLYPLYLAGTYLIFGFHPLAARLVQVVLSGVLSTWLLYQLGKRLFDEKVGLVSAALGATYIYFIYYDATLMTESFFILCVLASLLISFRVLKGSIPAQNGEPFQKSSLRDWVTLGVLFGLAALLRQTILLWIPFLLAWLFWATKAGFRWKGLWLTLGITAAFVLPWTARNYIAYKAFLPLNSNAAYALYSSNHPDQGTHFDQDYVAPLPPDLVNSGFNEAQWSAALTRRGLGFILEDPQRYLMLSLSRVPIFFNFWFSAESNLSSNLMRILSYGLYFPFFLYGLILSLRNWQRNSLIYLFGLVYSFMHILTWASVRYRLPIDAAMLPFAAFALIDVFQRLQLAVRHRTQVISAN